jgi:hypothetical protein
VTLNDPDEDAALAFRCLSLSGCLGLCSTLSRRLLYLAFSVKLLPKLKTLSFRFFTVSLRLSRLPLLTRKPAQALGLECTAPDGDTVATNCGKG